MGSLFLELENIGGKLIAYPIIFCLITFFHYCFAFMHTSFETFMFFYNKDRFALIEKSLDYIYQYTGKHFKFEKLNKRLYEKC